MKAICNKYVPVESQAPNTSSQTKKKVPQGKKPKARSGLRRKQSSKHTSESKTEASKSKTGQSDKETQSSLAKDKSPSHPSASTLVVAEMHKEAQQAAGGCDASTDSTAEADPVKSAPNDSIPSQQDVRVTRREETQRHEGTHATFSLNETNDTQFHILHLLNQFNFKRSVVTFLGEGESWGYRDCEWFGYICRSIQIDVPFCPPHFQMCDWLGYQGKEQK
ncbi:hypothetical protein Tco_1210895 [Tanacetum coccineum]